jgi:hypothetical protein
MLGRIGDWDRFSGHVLTSNTLDTIPSEFHSYLTTKHTYHHEILFNVSIDKQKYRGGTICLIDAGGRDVGLIFAIMDSTSISSHQTLFGSLAVIISIIIIILVIFFSKYVGNIEGNLIKTHNNLNDEIEERKKAEKQLEEHRDRLDDMVQERTAELEAALGRVQLLSGLLPICASCKKIRDDTGYWNQIEIYIRDHSEADFTHGICPECAKKLYPGLYKG